MRERKPILIAENVRKEFGGLAALHELSFHLEEGEIRAIIGPNGAGKTTAINIITGIYPPTSGRIVFESRVISGLKPFLIACMGITRTFQNIQIFQNMTVLENVMVGLHSRTESEFLSCLFHLPGVRREEKSMRARAFEILEFLKLSDKAHWMSGVLPYGLQKRLEIARAMAVKPKVLLLDEPVAGLDISESQEMSSLILEIRERGITILLVEHNMNLVMGISDEITVLNYGVKIAEGTSGEIQNNEEVIKAYLGEEE
jgi:branched-chain amino acid transport system ATP-binding protein